MAAVEIPLTRGKVALVNESDAPEVLAFKWQAVTRRGLWYARRVAGGKRFAKGKPRPRRTFYLHQFIMKPSPGQVVDHKDGDGLNCQRSNMRVCSQGQNIRSMKTMSTNKSGYRGVSFDKTVQKKPWKAQIVFETRARHLGRFATPEEAAKAYDAKAKKLFGEFAKLNFPNV